MPEPLDTLDTDTTPADPDLADDGGGDEGSVMITVGIIGADGTQWNATGHVPTDHPDPDTVADMLLRATQGAAYLHSHDVWIAVQHRMHA